MNKDIAETCQNMTSKYHAIEVKISEMQNEVINEITETREYYNTSYHELRVGTNTHVNAINISHRELQLSLEENNDETKSSGTTYVQWGRTTSPGNGSDIVYSGYAGGSHHNHRGAAASMLCLPMDHDWAQHSDKENYDSELVYGSEYESYIDRMDDFFGPGHRNKDVPCAVCNIRTYGTGEDQMSIWLDIGIYWLSYVRSFSSRRCHGLALTKSQKMWADDGRLLYFVD